MSGDAAKVGGFFDKLSVFVVRRPFLVIGAWCALALALFLIFPPLMDAAAGKNDAAKLPDDAPTMVTAREMSKAFDQKSDKKDEKPKEGSQLLVILTDENGLGAADLATYHTLVDKLKDAKFQVQDFITIPQLHEILASKDNKAWNLPVIFDTGQDDPVTQSGYKQIQETVNQTLHGTTLSAHYAGAVATVDDLVTIGVEDTHLIEIGTGVSVFLILLMVYRNIVTMLVPLATIGLSLATAQGLLSGLTLAGLNVQLQTVVFMTAVMIGGGVDYAVFLISRYHDYVRHGDESDVAVKKAMMSIGKVIAASAATVAVTFLAMVFAKLAVFSTIGPAISVSIIVAFVAAITLLPAIMTLIGRRGWIKPRRELTRRFWRVLGTRTVRRPVIHLMGSLIILGILASSTLLVRFNYDDMRALPQDVASVEGFRAMDNHFPKNMMTPMILFIKSPRDLRNPTALADLEQMAVRVAQVHDIIAIRGLTRPNGEPLEQTKVSYQAGEVGGKLGEATTAIQQHSGDLDKLADGSNQLASALAMVRDQVTQSVADSRQLVSILVTMKQLIGGDKTLNELDKMSQLIPQMRTLGDQLTANSTKTNNIVNWATPLVAALDGNPTCDSDPSCVSSRSQLDALVQARRSGTLGSINDLGHTLQQTSEYQTVAQTIDKLKSNLDQAISFMRSVDGMNARLDQLVQGANGLAQGSSLIAQGVTELVKQTKNMGNGLDQASSFLLGMKRDASRPSMGGFNIPPQAMASDEFKKGVQAFIAPDGHGARYLVQSGLNPFSTQAMDQVNEILTAARTSQPNSELADATISLAGIPSGLVDIRTYYQNDIKFIVVATIAIVFMILVILLRAIVAPLYLIGSVLVSFLSAVGLGVIVFQLILGQELHWSLPGLSFILLVAVGADYNMLLISRIRDESPHGVRVGVIRTVASTGGVITSAGLIFAASMFGLLAASIMTMVEAGFIIGAGIMIDTFLVRSITVPAIAALIGQANWWPSKLGERQTTRPWVYNQKTKSKPGLLARLKSMQPRQIVFIAASPSRATAPPVVIKEVVPAPSKAPSFVNEVDDEDSFPLPLFGSVRLAREILPNCPAPANGKAAQPDDVHGELEGQALPVFGPSVPGQQLVNVRTPTPTPTPTPNGNGNIDANGGGETDGEDLDCQALPLFGHLLVRAGTSSASAAAQATIEAGNGNGNAGQSIDHSLPLFGPVNGLKARTDPSDTDPTDGTQ